MREVSIGRSVVWHADCMEWLATRDERSVHAVVTDPPYGIREFTGSEVGKLRAGRGGVWRQPPAPDGKVRRPVPRFTVLTPADHAAVTAYFATWARAVARVLVPGAHLFMASHPLVKLSVWPALVAAGLEPRGEVVRLVGTLRGGDRPKGAADEFPEVCTMPRSCYEPWGVFRAPLDGTVAANLRRWGTGALRRPSPATPLPDVVRCGPAKRGERALSDHPTLKPQRLMRWLVRAALPTGDGIVLDPFMGSGSTVAAAEALGYQAVGVESDTKYFTGALESIPRLAAL